MPLNPADEPPLDAALSHYLEARALTIALDKAISADQRAKVERLMELRGKLMQHRESFGREATVKRHARGEIYSKAKVAAINAMAPGKKDLDDSVNSLYMRQRGSEEVLKAHARAHFGFGLVSARLMLAHLPPDIADAARDMQKHEDSFVSAWVSAIGDAAFKTELRDMQGKALRLLRTSTCPIYLVTYPESVAFDDEDARNLGKAWNKLDELAIEAGVEPLSTFVSLDGEQDCGNASVSRIVISVSALVAALETPGNKFPSKRAIKDVLTKIRDILLQPGNGERKACFEIDV